MQATIKTGTRQEIRAAIKRNVKGFFHCWRELRRFDRENQYLAPEVETLSKEELFAREYEAGEKITGLAVQREEELCR